MAVMSHCLLFQPLSYPSRQTTTDTLSPQGNFHFIEFQVGEIVQYMFNFEYVSLKKYSELVKAHPFLLSKRTLQTYLSNSGLVGLLEMCTFVGTCECLPRVARVT